MDPKPLLIPRIQARRHLHIHIMTDTFLPELVRLIEETRVIPPPTAEIPGVQNEEDHIIDLPLQIVILQHDSPAQICGPARLVTILLPARIDDFPRILSTTIHGHDNPGSLEISWQSACLSRQIVGNRLMVPGIIGSPHWTRDLDVCRRLHTQPVVGGGQDHLLQLLVNGICMFHALFFCSRIKLI